MIKTFATIVKKNIAMKNLVVIITGWEWPCIVAEGKQVLLVGIIAGSAGVIS